MYLKNGVKKTLLYHIAALAVIMVILFVYKCPFNYFLHIPCPGCGITRAYLALLDLDVGSAFRYHPLFFTVAPTILYTVHRDVLKIRLSAKAETILFTSLIVLFLAVYVIRLCTGSISDVMLSFSGSEPFTSVLQAF